MRETLLHDIFPSAYLLLLSHIYNLCKTISITWVMSGLVRNQAWGAFQVQLKLPWTASQPCYMQQNNSNTLSNV
jgi:hypothetical protein